MNIDGSLRVESRVNDAVSAPRQLNTETPKSDSSSTNTTNTLVSSGLNKADNGVPVKAMNNAIKEINKSIEKTDTSLEMSIFKPTHEIVVKLKDNKTGEVIRQIPSQKILDLAVYMKKLSGIFVDTKI